MFVAFAAIAICEHPVDASFFDVCANDDTFIRTGDSTDQYGNVFEDREGPNLTTNYRRISGDTVPEPASPLMLVLGLIGLSGPGALRRRQLM